INPVQIGKLTRTESVPPRPGASSVKKLSCTHSCFPPAPHFEMRLAMTETPGSLELNEKKSPSSADNPTGRVRTAEFQVSPGLPPPAVVAFGLSARLKVNSLV